MAPIRDLSWGGGELDDGVIIGFSLYPSRHPPILSERGLSCCANLPR
jgi:hypothetical protein